MGRSTTPPRGLTPTRRRRRRSSRRSRRRWRILLCPSFRTWRALAAWEAACQTWVAWEGECLIWAAWEVLLRRMIRLADPPLRRSINQHIVSLGRSENLLDAEV